MRPTVAEGSSWPFALHEQWTKISALCGSRLRLREREEPSQTLDVVPTTQELETRFMQLVEPLRVRVEARCAALKWSLEPGAQMPTGIARRLVTPSKAPRTPVATDGVADAAPRPKPLPVVVLKARLAVPKPSLTPATHSVAVASRSTLRRRQRRRAAAQPKAKKQQAKSKLAKRALAHWLERQLPGAPWNATGAKRNRGRRPRQR